ncbi:MAG: CBS domain-containing protein, partial [Nitrospira sp.]|nr:CBS domain-containing protein [Nitrospira sp.]
MVTVSELMTKTLVTVPAGTSAADAARVMNERRVGSVFIEQNDRVIGIVTESDIVRKVVGENKPVHFVPVES